MLKPEKKRWKKDKDERPVIRAALPQRLSDLAKAGHATGTAAAKNTATAKKEKNRG